MKLASDELPIHVSSPPPAYCESAPLHYGRTPASDPSDWPLARLPLFLLSFFLSFFLFSMYKTCQNHRRYDSVRSIKPISSWCVSDVTSLSACGACVVRAPGLPSVHITSRFDRSPSLSPSPCTRTTRPHAYSRRKQMNRHNGTDRQTDRHTYLPVASTCCNVLIDVQRWLAGVRYFHERHSNKSVRGIPSTRSDSRLQKELLWSAICAMSSAVGLLQLRSWANLKGRHRCLETEVCATLKNNSRQAAIILFDWIFMI